MRVTLLSVSFTCSQSLFFPTTTAPTYSKLKNVGMGGVMRQPQKKRKKKRKAHTHTVDFCPSSASGLGQLCCGSQPRASSPVSQTAETPQGTTNSWLTGAARRPPPKPAPVCVCVCASLSVFVCRCVLVH